MKQDDYKVPPYYDGSVPLPQSLASGSTTPHTPVITPEVRKLLAGNPYFMPQKG